MEKKLYNVDAWGCYGRKKGPSVTYSTRSMLPSTANEETAYSSLYDPVHFGRSKKKKWLRNVTTKHAPRYWSKRVAYFGLPADSYKSWGLLPLSLLPHHLIFLHFSVYLTAVQATVL